MTHPFDGQDDEPPAGPLSGLRVIDLSVNVLGPVCTQILGDMDADVIKVEEPDGDYTRHVGPRRSDDMGALFLGINRNKRSIVLNLKDEADFSVLMKLVDTADVLIHTMRPGAAKRLGIDYETIRQKRPGLVYAWATGFRPGSSRSEAPAYDDVVQGLTGTAGMALARDGVPSYMPTVLADKHTGFVLANAVMAALLWRERTGKGQEVHVPMMEAMVAFNLLEHIWGRAMPGSGVEAGYTRILNPVRRPYPTSDGYLCVMPNTDRQWQRLLDLLGRPELASDPRYAKVAQRNANIHELYAIVAEHMGERSTEEWDALLEEADIAHGPANSLEALFDEPYLKETNFFREIEHPSEGTLLLTDIVPHLSASPGAMRRPPPRLGEHTEEILELVGLRKDAATGRYETISS